MEADDPNDVIEIGISIEANEVVAAQLESIAPKENALVVRNESGTTAVALKVLESFYNYCSSFPNIPAKLLQNWYEATATKIKNEPSFLN